VSQLKDMLMRHEGLRLLPYTDTAGKLTIGYGRNLTDNGISTKEADAMLDIDIASHALDVSNAFPWLTHLDSVRQDVLVDLCFNMGIAGLKGFPRMLQALEYGAWERAAQELLNSRYARQVGARATELAQMIRTGAYAV
jgi:lysozyme